MPTPSSAELGIWLGCLAAVMLILERGLALWKNHLRESPPPAQTYATRDECARRHASSAEEIVKLRQEFNAQIAHASDRRKETYEQIRQVRAEAVSQAGEIYDRISGLQTEMNTKFESVSRALGRIEGKLDKS